MTDLPETRLSIIDRIRGGDDTARREALDAFITAYRPALIAYLVKSRGVNSVDAEDLVNDFLLKKIIQGKVLDLANGQGRFRNGLRACIKTFLIDEYRKAKRRPHLVPELQEAEIPSSDDYQYDVEPLDRVWAIAVLSSALAQMKQESPQWGLFVDRILTQPPKSYDKLAADYQGMTRKNIYNALVTAKRTFNRILAAQLEAQEALSSCDSEGQPTREVELLQVFLAQPDALKEAVDLVVQGSLRSCDMSFPSTQLTMHDFWSLSKTDLASDSDILAMFQDLLRQSVSSFGIDGLSTCTLTASEFLDPACLVEEQKLLRFKEYFNQRGKGLSESDLPHAIDVAMTFAIICRFWVEHGCLDGVTSMREKVFFDRVGQLLHKSWLPETIRNLMQSISPDGV